ncbi:MAG: tetratricopeptide repeat protein [Bacteroidota bacterium]
MKKITPLILLLQILIACSPSAEEQKNTISQLEQKLTEQKKVTGIATSDSALTSKAIASYLEYASKNPDDTLSAVYLFKAGNLASQQGDFHTAEKSFEKLIEQYPKHPDAPIALFLLGFSFENMKGDQKSAEKCYRKFLELYPNHPRAIDVRYSLENIGKSPEELLRNIQKQDSIPS